MRQCARSVGNARDRCTSAPVEKLFAMQLSARVAFWTLQRRFGRTRTLHPTIRVGATDCHPEAIRAWHSDAFFPLHTSSTFVLVTFCLHTTLICILLQKPLRLPLQRQ